MERIHKVSIYVSADELQRLRLAAAHTGESLSEYARRAALLQADIEEQKRKAQQNQHQ